MSKDEADQADLVKVCSAGDNAEAAIIRGYLEEADIAVYVQGENHRSMLGMVGSYIELNILVPRRDLERAKELMVEYQEGTHQGISGMEIEGPFRDDFDDEEDEEEDDDIDNWLKSEEGRRRVRGARLAGLYLPFGGAHFSAGAYFNALTVLSACVIAIVFAQSSPLMYWLYPIAVVLDIATVPNALLYRERKRRRRLEAAKEGDTASD